MPSDVKENLQNKNAWIRLLYMIVFAVIFWVAEFVFWVVVVAQLLFSLILGSANDRILGFSNQLTRFIYDILRFLTYNTEDMPFPFSDWPSADTADDSTSSLPTEGQESED